MSDMGGLREYELADGRTFLLSDEDAGRYGAKPVKSAPAAKADSGDVEAGPVPVKEAAQPANKERSAADKSSRPSK